MSLTSLNTKFQLRRDTATNWTATNKGNDPVLADGEPVLAKVDGIYKMKIGDGSSKFSELSYYGGSSSSSAGKFTVTFTESNGDITADKTIAEIIEAKEAGDIVVGVYTSYGFPCEIPCIAALEMQIEGQAFPVAAFAGPVASEGTKIATISGFLDDGSDSWNIDLSELGSDVSYDDLEDKPFYEETVSPGINYQIPYTDGSNPDHHYQIPFAGTTADAYLYRVGDALTASQLEGATIGMVVSAQGGGDDASTATIPSSSITEVTGGRYIMSDGFPYVFVADTDDVDIDIQDLTNFKSLNAGTYLVYIDAESLQSGAHLYSDYLSKAAVTTVHKLNAKFYDSYAPLIVTLTQENGTWTAEDGVTIADVIEAYGDGKECVAIINFSQYSVEAPLTICVEQASTVIFAAATYLQSNYIVSAMGDGSSNSDSWVIDNYEITNELPSFTSSNNGQVLSVSSGSLAWVTPSGGSEKFVVPITDNAGVTTDITFAQIKAAYDAGKDVEASIYIGIFNTTIKAVLSFVNADTAEFVGCVYSPLDTKTRIYSCYCYTGGGSDTWNSHTIVVEDFPSYSSSNNGQVLGVSSGDLAWVTPSSGAEKFVVHFTESNDTITADQSMANIYAAKQAGKMVIGQMEIEGALVEFNMPIGTIVEQTMMIIEFTAPIWIEGPELATLLGYAMASDDTFQGDEWELSRSEISSESSESVSWNDLTDRPFYETVTAAGYNFEIDLDDPNYVSGYANIGEDISAKFYRVGDPLTAAQLVGAMGTVNSVGEENSHVIESNYIEEIEDNGDTVGLLVAGDMPYCLVINNANTTIDVDATNDRPFGFSGTFASAGTYLYWIDLSTMGEGASAYAVSLVKEAEATITPLPDKYYKAPLIVEITGTTENNITTYSANATYSEILTTLQAERPVYATFTNSNFNTIIIQAKALIPGAIGAINFSTMAYIGSSIYAIKIEINDQDEVSANVTTFGSAQGVNF